MTSHLEVASKAKGLSIKTDIYNVRKKEISNKIKVQVGIFGAWRKTQLGAQVGVERGGCWASALQPRRE